MAEKGDRINLHIPPRRSRGQNTSRNAVRRVLHDSPRAADDDRRERCEIMTVKELYLANCDWITDTKLHVTGLTGRLLYEGFFHDMPDEIVDSQVVTFNSRLIITR